MEIWEYPAVMHAKVTISDDTLIVGTVNLDAWALYRNSEIMMIARSAETAALIVEPLVQGAGGMHAYPVACLQVLRDIADEHDLVLVFDEIATGFGRTGTLFAADAAGVTPGENAVDTKASSDSARARLTIDT